MIRKMPEGDDMRKWLISLTLFFLAPHLAGAQVNIEGVATGAEFTLSSYYPTLPLWLAVGAALVPMIVFLYMVRLGYKNGGQLSKDETRQSVSAALVVGGTELVVMMVGMGHPYGQSATITYLTAMGMVAAFYL